MLQVRDDARIRVLTLDRPEALNAFNEELYDATTEALLEAAQSPQIAVVVLTGNGRAFSAGTDVVEMASRTTEPESFQAGVHGFRGLIDQLTVFPKPFVCAVNGMALGIGATVLGFADLALMSTAAKVRCPFTDLAVAPEAASSYLLPLLVGRQQATWLLMSGAWFSAEECQEMGLVWRVTAPEDLLPATLEAASTLAAKPIASLVETKRTIVSAHRELIGAARQRENTAFARLLGQPANLEAFAARAERRPPDFVTVDTEHPADIALHAAD
jgi:enoyl-CoA hydratase/carnithine racemase